MNSSILPTQTSFGRTFSSRYFGSAKVLFPCPEKRPGFNGGTDVLHHTAFEKLLKIVKESSFQKAERWFAHNYRLMCIFSDNTFSSLLSDLVYASPLMAGLLYCYYMFLKNEKKFLVPAISRSVYKAILSRAKWALRFFNILYKENPDHQLISDLVKSDKPNSSDSFAVRHYHALVDRSVELTLFEHILNTSNMSKLFQLDDESEEDTFSIINDAIETPFVNDDREIWNARSYYDELFLLKRMFVKYVHSGCSKTVRYVRTYVDFGNSPAFPTDSELNLVVVDLITALYHDIHILKSMIPSTVTSGTWPNYLNSLTKRVRNSVNVRLELFRTLILEAGFPLNPKQLSCIDKPGSDFKITFSKDKKEGAYELEHNPGRFCTITDSDDIFSGVPSLPSNAMPFTDFLRYDNYTQLVLYSYIENSMAFDVLFEVYKKEKTSKDCLIAVLPKEIMRKITSYLTISTLKYNFGDMREDVDQLRQLFMNDDDGSIQGSVMIKALV